MEITKKMEIDAINAAEAGRLKDAIDILNAALTIAPKRPSLYNNRAQVHQLLKNFDGTIKTQRNFFFILLSLLLEALNDLTQAIKNADGGQQKRTLRQALCQRGLLYRKKEMLEEARGDFSRAAEMGSKFAKNQLVEMNPYAALCNQMLRQVVNQYK